jgi:hypothetical protein
MRVGGVVQEIKGLSRKQVKSFPVESQVKNSHKLKTIFISTTYLSNTAPLKRDVHDQTSLHPPFNITKISVIYTHAVFK